MVPIGSSRTSNPSPVGIGAESPGQAPRRCGGRASAGAVMPSTSARSAARAGVDVVAARMPEAAAPRGIEPLGNRRGGCGFSRSRKSRTAGSAT